VADGELRPRRISRAELREAVTSGAFVRLIGVIETGEIDFKARYDLETNKGKRDLVADVASFANANGGLIVVGARVTKDPDEQTEYCSSLQGVQAGTLTESQVISLVRTRTFPPVEVLVESFRGTSEKGDEVDLVVIDVRPRRPSDGPIIVDRLVSDELERLSGAVAWPTRHGDGTHWEHGSRIQQLIALGLRGGSSSSPTGSPRPSPNDDLKYDLDAEPGWDEWARLVITATPVHHQTVDDFWGEFRDDANQWAPLRPDGFHWGLRSYNHLEPRQGELVSSSGRTFLAVSTSGRIISAAVGSPDFLGWGKNAFSGISPLAVQFNPWPFVEITAETLRFAEDFVGPKVDAGEWHVTGTLEHLLDRVPVAFQVELGQFPFREPFEAKANDATFRIDSEGDWSRDAFRLLEGLLGRAFAIGRKDIPLSESGRVKIV
jgi:hypothetical protein